MSDQARQLTSEESILRSKKCMDLMALGITHALIDTLSDSVTMAASELLIGVRDILQSMRKASVDELYRGEVVFGELCSTYPDLVADVDREEAKKNLASLRDRALSYVAERQSAERNEMKADLKVGDMVKVLIKDEPHYAIITGTLTDSCVEVMLLHDGSCARHNVYAENVIAGYGELKEEDEGSRKTVLRLALVQIAERLSLLPDRTKIRELIESLWSEPKRCPNTAPPSDMEIVHCFDARKWAAYWMSRIHLYPGIPKDENCMVTWFSCAIMAGYDQGKADGKKQQDPPADCSPAPPVKPDVLCSANEYMWTSYWHDMLKQHPGIHANHETMLAWFRAALNAGYSQGKADGKKQAEKAASEGKKATAVSVPYHCRKYDSGEEVYVRVQEEGDKDTIKRCRVVNDDLASQYIDVKFANSCKQYSLDRDTYMRLPVPAVGTSVGFYEKYPSRVLRRGVVVNVVVDSKPKYATVRITDGSDTVYDEQVGVPLVDILPSISETIESWTTI